MTDPVLGIDARVLAADCKRQGHGGIGTYTRSLLRAWYAQPPAEPLVLLGGEKECTSPGQLPPSVRRLDDARLRDGFVADHWCAPRALAAAGAQVAWYPSQLQAPLYQPLPTVVTVHDLIPEKYPALYPADLRERLRRAAMRRACRRAAALIAVSGATRDDIVARWGIPAERITVIHEAPRPSMRVPPDAAELDAVRERYALPPRFLLYVGGLDPRKTFAMALAGAGTLPPPQRLPWLALSGNRDALAEAALLNAGSAAGIEVRIAGPVRGDDLPAIYHGATALVMPTRDEGCSLPVLDALAAGLPVVASAAGAIPEMAGDAYVAVCAETPAAWGAALAAVQKKDRQQQLRAAGPQQVAHLTWEKAAAATLDVLHRAAGGSCHG